MLIIGITGTLGAGKGTIVQYMTEVEHFNHFSVRGFLINEIKCRKLPVNRDSMTSIANELRAANSPSFIIDELFKLAEKSGKDCIIESIRTPGEVESLKTKGNFWLVAVDADPKVRYERIRQRKSTTDTISYETFLDNEQREFTSVDPNKQDLKRCIEMADFIFNNNGTKEQLNDQVKIVLDIIRSEYDSR